jgi:hypothetical protein
VSFTLSSHWVCPCPSNGCFKSLGTLISTMGGCSSKERVSEHIMWKPLIAEHLVFGLKLSCKHGFKTGANTPLHSPLNSLLGMLRGHHPPGCKGFKVDKRCIACLHVPSQVCINTRNDGVRGQYPMEVAVVHRISQVSSQGLKRIDMFGEVPSQQHHGQVCQSNPTSQSPVLHTEWSWGPRSMSWRSGGV